MRSPEMGYEMSRTFKDAPYLVRVFRLKRKQEWHRYCEHSLTGGRWVYKNEVVNHDPEWHLVDTFTAFCCSTKYGLPYSRVMTKEALISHLVNVHGHSERSAESELSKKTSSFVRRGEEWVFGPWQEVVRLRVFETMKCDIEPDILFYSRRWGGCQYEPVRWDEVPSGSPSGVEARRLAYKRERAVTRDVLKDAVREYNTFGDTEPDFHKNRFLYEAWWC